MVAPNHVEANGMMSSRYDGLDTIAALLEIERYRLRFDRLSLPPA
jgi:hypothetical protein